MYLITFNFFIIGRTKMKKLNLLLKGIFSGIFLLLFLNTKALAEEEYIITLQADARLYFSSKDEGGEWISGSLNHKGDCMRLTLNQFADLAITHTIPIGDKQVSFPICDTRHWQFMNFNINRCKYTTHSDDWECVKYSDSVHACTPGNYDLIQIPEVPFIRMNLTSEEPLVDPFFIEESSVNKGVTCLNSLLETTHCEGHTALYKCLNETEDNKTTCSRIDKPHPSHCKTLKISSVSKD